MCPAALWMSAFAPARQPLSRSLGFRRLRGIDQAVPVPGTRQCEQDVTPNIPNLSCNRAPTVATGSTHEAPSTRAIADDHAPATAPVRTNNRPHATTGARTTVIKAASGHTFNGDVAEFDVRNSVNPQRP